jgi:predicted phosphodiesterase
MIGNYTEATVAQRDAEIIALHKAGYSYRMIAARVACGYGTVYKVLRRNGRLTKQLEAMYKQPTANKPVAGLLNLEPPQEPTLDLPHGYVDIEGPYVITGRRIGIISDVHVPSHDKYALEAAIRYLRNVGIDTLVINGDYMDFYQISDHDKDKTRAITFGDELEAGRIILGQIRAFLGPNVEIVYQEGNHEERYKRFLPQAMASDKVRGSTVPEQLDLQAHGITWVGNRRGCKAGRLMIYHGHEMRASGVNAARNLITRLMDNVVIGHLHRPQSIQRPRMNGDTIGAWVSGCLCDLRPFYFPINEWQHGFNLVTVDNEGMFRVESKLVINGVVY